MNSDVIRYFPKKTKALYNTIRELCNKVRNITCHVSYTTAYQKISCNFFFWVFMSIIFMPFDDEPESLQETFFLYFFEEERLTCFGVLSISFKMYVCTCARPLLPTKRQPPPLPPKPLRLVLDTDQSNRKIVTILRAILLVKVEM